MHSIFFYVLGDFSYKLFCQNTFRMMEQQFDMMLENKDIQDDCSLKIKQYLLTCVFFFFLAAVALSNVYTGCMSWRRPLLYDCLTVFQFVWWIDCRVFPQPFLMPNGNTSLVFSAERQCERYFCCCCCI